HDEEVLAKLQGTGAPVRVFAAGQPLGESSLLRAAIPLAKGDIIVTLPAYPRVQGQALLPLVGRGRQGRGLAAAAPCPRQASGLTRLQSRIFHALLTPATGRDFHDLGSSVNAIRRDILNDVPLYGDFLRFLPVLAAREGFRVEEVNVP